ncbi:MAG: hypothetical protein M1503_00760 [Thaumarchaeota archaeon]|nr:hypothetical protein [Nitrososphaerota archaeon]MCL5316784.1 hypothetical protein [Nitrososphaerota archaeon]
MEKQIEVNAAAGSVTHLCRVAFTMIWGFGRSKHITGSKTSAAPPASKEELKLKLLALNSPNLPYEIKPVEETDLLVEWKIVDAHWYQIISKERLSETYRAYILLDDDKKEARYFEEMGTVSWSAGVNERLNPQVEYKKTAFRGRNIYNKSWGAAYGIKDDLAIGKIYEYSFDVKTVREPIKKTVEQNGWKFQQVTRKENTTY